MTSPIAAIPLERLAIEKEFKEHLDMFTSEVESVNQFYYASMAIQHAYSVDLEIRGILDEFRLVTLTMLGSLQTSLLVTLGRIFDDESKYSIHKLIQFMREHPWMFSTDALRARKLRIAHPSPVDTWIDTIDSYPCTNEVFPELSRLVRPHRKMYESKLSHIRDKWVAHREFNGFQANQMFGQTQLEEVENALGFLLGFGLGIWQWYHNGHKPEIVQDLDNYERRHPLEPRFSMRHQKETAEQMTGLLKRLSKNSAAQSSER